MDPLSATKLDLLAFDCRRRAALARGEEAALLRDLAAGYDGRAVALRAAAALVQAPLPRAVR